MKENKTLYLHFFVSDEPVHFQPDKPCNWRVSSGLIDGKDIVESAPMFDLGEYFGRKAMEYAIETFYPEKMDKIIEEVKELAK